MVWVERDFSGMYHTISIFHIFYHLCSKYYHLSTFTHHVYLRVGDIERAWLTRSVVSKTLIHFDFYTFLVDTSKYFSHWGYLACFCSVLLHVNICAQISLWCPCTSPYIYTLFFSFILVSGRGQLAYWATVYGYHGDHSERPVFCIK